MKIEINPFNDRARYTQPIIFMRLNKRSKAMKPVPRFLHTTSIGKFRRTALFLNS
jgi:hypothetical protein